MTREQLFEAIGSLDEAMLDENVEQVKSRRNFGWLAGIAACAAVCAGVFFLPKLLPEESIAPLSPFSGSQTTEPATEFVGFLEGVSCYPLPEGSAPDAVCEDGAWLAPKLGESAYFVMNEMQGLYQFVDPFSSAMPETGTYSIENNVITAVSYDGMQTHTLSILEGGYALELLTSTSWEGLTGRIFTSRYDAEKPFADVTAAQISNVTCNERDISMNDAQMEEFAGLLQNVVRYQQLLAEDELRVGGRSISFTLTENGEESHIGISYRFWKDGMKYLLDQESCNALFDFLTPLAEDAQAESENTPKTLPYLHGVTYRMLDSEHSGDSAYNSFSAAIGFDMKITFRSSNYQIDYLNPTWEDERGTYTIEDGVVICTNGENTHRFEIMNDYTIRFASSTNAYITDDNFKDRMFTCRLFPQQYFEDHVSDAKGFQCGIRRDGEVISVQLPENRINECLDALHEITVYSESVGSLSWGTVDTADMDYLFIDRAGDAQDMQVYIGKYIAIDGKIYVYEKDTADALYDLFKVYSTEDIPDPAQVLDNLDSFYHASAVHYTSGKGRELSGEEFAQLKDLLRNIVLLEEDTSEDLLFGDTLSYTLTKENGVTISIQPGGNRITINNVRYFTEYAPCEALNQFGHNLLGTRFAEPDVQDTAEYTKPDASNITPIPVTNEVGGITKDLIYGRSLWTFKHIQQLSGMTKICGGKNSATITEGSFRFDLRNDLYHSDVYSYLNDGTNALAQHDQRWKNGERSVELSEYEDDALEDHIWIEEHQLIAYDENGKFLLTQGGDPTNAHDLGCCFIPYEIARGYLKDRSRWEMLGTAEYQGRECVVIEGEGGDYGERYGVETFTLWVDLQTGVWMFFEGCDAEGNVNDYVYTKDMRFDAEAQLPEMLTDAEFQALSEVYPVKKMDYSASPVGVSE